MVFINFFVFLSVIIEYIFQKLLPRLTSVLGMQIGQGNDLVALGDALHHVVAAILAAADHGHDPHLGAAVFVCFFAQCTSRVCVCGFFPLASSSSSALLFPAYLYLYFWLSLCCLLVAKCVLIWSALLTRDCLHCFFFCFCFHWPLPLSTSSTAALLSCFPAFLQIGLLVNCFQTVKVQQLN